MQASKAELVITENVSDLWSITLPVMCGRALFMIAGIFTWAARNRSWSIATRNASSYFWWTTVLFTVGASLFYWGYFITASPFELMPRYVVKNWFGVLTGYIAGSGLLLAASYALILDLANKEEQGDIEAALIKV